MKYFRTVTLALTLSVVTIPAFAAQLATVYSSPTCGCCEEWVAYLKTNGFDVKVIPTDDVGGIAERMHVPATMGACHTALIGGYVVEGHVPVEAITKLIAEKPDVIGIATPGMPQGSPGMSGPKEPFTVYSFGPLGESIFMRF